MTLLIEAPTDPQLALIRDLCASHDCLPPDIVCSKTEASEIITAIKSGAYDWRKYRYPFGDAA